MPDGKIARGDVVVLRYQGPVGGPGMPEMTALTGAIIGAGLGPDVAVVTDGRFGHGTQRLCIGYVAPQAALGGPLALVRDGDVIEIDVEAGILHLHVPPAQLEDRRLTFKARLHGARTVCSRNTRNSLRPPSCVP